MEKRGEEEMNYSSLWVDRGRRAGEGAARAANGMQALRRLVHAVRKGE